MPRRAKHPKLPNGYGSIKYLGPGRINCYAVHPPTTEFTLDGVPKTPKALCYVDDWYKGFTVLTWYKRGEYYPGREAELQDDSNNLQMQVQKILSQYNQNTKAAKSLKTFSEVFMDYYKEKFKQDYGHMGKKVSMERSMCAAYKNASSLHDKTFTQLTQKDLQDVIDSCTLKRSSIELILVLFRQMYVYAEANDIAEKNYAKFVRINKEEDDEHGIPFTYNELKKLWKNKDNEIVEMILIMCYSGFRVTAYKSLKIDLEQKFFQGGIKNESSKGRIVPIHSGIYDLVKRRLMRNNGSLIEFPDKFRNSMYETLNTLGIEKHTPHDCRHTFSKLCEDYEVAENDRKRMLGHSFGNDITNKVYGHRDLEKLREEIEKIKICY
ncbi:MAG: integrase [Faecalicatena sp.]|uniref:tyrosine-type recombinase/integrase n=1 Tax=Faecalicatena sp. TaxID=2005360 RepID=UPI002583852A|nr:integrase [Faecalicatena sp.]MCI6468175.1 integrase [Faecalicatena sp.]MDY5620430.1 integrase [Lachnospiraceae bacterium]